MSGSDNKKKIIPVAPVLPAVVPGNLLSSIAPPSELPNFVTAPVLQKPNVIVPVSQPVQPTSVVDNAAVESTEQETFSPAIPPNKGEPTLPIRSPEDSQATQSPESLPPSTPEIDRIGDVMPGSGLLTWMKGAVSSGGILQRVAEKAKSSVDTMITTLDPQMKEYLKSGGDLYVVVASDKEVNVSPIREAFQNVFGKATVVGEASQCDVTAAQAVGSAAAYAAAKQRLAHVRATAPHVNNNVPVVAVQAYLQETAGDRSCIYQFTFCCYTYILDKENA
ncbi:PREDICTED: protein PRRC1-like [Papilio polytes]|uniref:protein PRRC1-like n=1 Tax=Papilio polytes TaxID=76194 RepID=UPI000676625F|nr:PREDICTED: protein PRRC1-like [Papilio polytes]